MSWPATNESSYGSGTFPRTHWSAVVAAGGEGTPKAEAALSEFCRVYWYPLYAFARRKGHQPADAQDLTQGFFAHLIDSTLLMKADPEKGRFRSFLLGCFINYLKGEQRHAQTRKRGGGGSLVPMDPQEVEQRLSREACLEATPESLYDRNWAVAVLEEALKRLQAEFKASGRGPLFEQLQPYLQGDVSGPSYAEVAERLGTTKGTIRVTVHRLRERYRTLLRTVVSQTVNGPVETDLELAHLMTALRG
jgi:RNA polymerase sigma-70 factor (ECF subfamily)